MNIKECGECTLCCRGTITLRVNEHKVLPGQPCPHVSESGCGIYDDLSRPHMCDSYSCMWASEWSFPDWIRPDKVGFLLTLSIHRNTVMLTSDFSGNNIDGAALLWVIEWCRKVNMTLVYTVKGKEGQGDYVRGNVKSHPKSMYMTGSLTEIFEPIELLNDE